MLVSERVAPWGRSFEELVKPCASFDFSVDMSPTLICRMANHNIGVISCVTTYGHALHVAPNVCADVISQFWSYTTLAREKEHKARQANNLLESNYSSYSTSAS